MTTYTKEELNEIIVDVIQDNTDPTSWAWLSAESNTISNFAFNTAFTIIPRKTGKTVITITQKQRELLSSIRPGFTIDNWTTDRLSRVWLLIQYDKTDEDRYFQVIENLFSVAEMNEQMISRKYLIIHFL